MWYFDLEVSCCLRLEESLFLKLCDIELQQLLKNSQGNDCKSYENLFWYSQLLVKSTGDHFKVYPYHDFSMEWEAGWLHWI